VKRNIGCSEGCFRYRHVYRSSRGVAAARRRLSRNMAKTKIWQRPRLKLVSSPANAGDPVFQGNRAGSARPWRTGYPLSRGMTAFDAATL